MGQRKTSDKRRLLDHYPTPQLLANSALTLFPAPDQSETVLDPGCGTGVWGKAARAAWGNVKMVGVDLEDYMQDDSPYSLLIRDDFFNFAKKCEGRFAYIVGNPPYNLAEQFIRASIRLLQPAGVLVFLLRLNFLEGSGRGRGLFVDYPLRQIRVCVSRPDFTGGGGDMTAYALFVWQRDWRGETTLSHFDWKGEAGGRQLTLPLAGIR